MNKTSSRFLVALNVLSDGILVLCTYLFVSWFWLDVIKSTPKNMAYVDGLREGVGLIACVYSVVLVTIMACFHVYGFARKGRRRSLVARVAMANLLGVLFVGSALFLFRLQEFSRGVLFLFPCFTIVLVSLKHLLFDAIVNGMFRDGYFHKNVLIVGSGELAMQYCHDVMDDDDPRVSVKGYVGVENPAFELTYLGPLDTLESYLQNSVIDETIIALEDVEAVHIRPSISLCDKCGTRVSVVPFYNDLLFSTPQVENVGRSMEIHLRSNQLDNLAFALFKRFSDIVLSAVALVVLSPLMLAIAVGVKLSSPGPVLFKQTRVGLNKKPFTMLKFRSMRLNNTENTAWTTNADARRTRFGSFIRKCSLDELPQLWNVLRGDMSLIGPRPELPYHVERFKETVPLYMVKHQVRPGITGWAQVCGYRGDTSIKKRIDCDIWYIENMSVGLEFKIVWKTLIGAWINREKVTTRERPAKHKSEQTQNVDAKD